MTHTNTEAVSDLLPCPFCGGEAKINEIWRDDNCSAPRPHRVYLAQCEGCEAFIESESPEWWSGAQPRAENEKDLRAKARAIAAWNRRAANSAGGVDGALENSVRRLRDILGEWARYHSDEVTSDIDAALYEADKLLSDAPAVEAEPVADAAAIIAHVQGYDTPTESDPRRRYTQAQLETAIRLAFSSSVSAEVTVTDEMVEVAARAMGEVGGRVWLYMREDEKQDYRADARAALNAALSSINGGRENG